MRWPRSVTLSPIGLPVRILNWAIERRAFITIGFWPVIIVRSPDAASIALAFVSASPRPMLTTIFSSRGTWFGLAYSNCLTSAGTTSLTGSARAARADPRAAARSARRPWLALVGRGCGGSRSCGRLAPSAAGAAAFGRRAAGASAACASSASAPRR